MEPAPNINNSIQVGPIDLRELARIEIYYATRFTAPGTVVQAALVLTPKWGSSAPRIEIPIRVDGIDAEMFAIEARRVMEACRFPELAISELRATKARVSQKGGRVEHAWVFHELFGSSPADAGSLAESVANKITDGDDPEDPTSVEATTRRETEAERRRRSDMGSLENE
jgi:hypothetical protein